MTLAGLRPGEKLFEEKLMAVYPDVMTVIINIKDIAEGLIAMELACVRKGEMGIELLLSESRVRVFKIEDELKYIYENEEMDSGN